MAEKPSLSPFVRAASQSDAAEIARLLTVLGHATATDEVATRWRAWAAGNLAIVADRGGGSLAGLVTLHMMTVLHRPQPVGRITALVVDPDERGRGVGRTLVATAEEAMVAAKCGLLEVTSNEQLVGAHAFYLRLGYQHTSSRFVKTLDGNTPNATPGIELLMDSA